MTFAQYAALSVNDARVLVQIDISKNNIQWVCAGAGIWKLNIAALYPEVGPAGDDLLNGFYAQNFQDIGSVQVDGISQTSVATLAALTNDTEAYYWDNVANELHVCLINFDEPWMHTINLGIIYGYSFDEFVPIGAASLYEGRLIGSPQISQSRDPMFWGKMQFEIGNITLINADGDFDTFGQDFDIYGNEARFLYGYKQLNISDYATLNLNLISAVDISEEEISISLTDKRAQLTKPIQYVCTAKNALDAIVEILTTSYGIAYTSTYFDTTAWAAAQVLAPNITVRMDTSNEVMSCIDLIEKICADFFGLFLINPDGRYSFKIVDTSASAETTIVHADILNQHSYAYDSSEVISRTRIGYDKNWTPGYTTPYYWLTDTTREAAIFLKYKTYNQAERFTLLTNLAAAQVFSDKLLDYAQDIHAIGEITVPMQYYTYGVGSIVSAEIWREKSSMLGTKKVEIISKAYNLRESNIAFGYRVV